MDGGGGGDSATAGATAKLSAAEAAWQPDICRRIDGHQEVRERHRSAQGDNHSGRRSGVSFESAVDEGRTSERGETLSRKNDRDVETIHAVLD